VLALADQDREVCYLETCAELNLAFYERHAFAVTELVNRAGLPTFWTMIRPPA